MTSFLLSQIMLEEEEEEEEGTFETKTSCDYLTSVGEKGRRSNIKATF